MIDYVQLGGTLFIPATHENLSLILSGEKYENLKSVVVDTEDSVSQKDLPKALNSLKNTLRNFQKNEISVFIRPRNPLILKEILEYENIEKIDGFLFPKCSLSNLESYFDLVRNTKHSVMPSIEGEELFDVPKLQALREKLLLFQERIVLVRFGLEDMLRQLGMRRGCSESVFDFSVSNTVLGNFLAVFKSAGFAVSGGVYPCFKDEDGFIKDLKRDLKEGLFSKTIIHPKQINPINELYKVSEEEYEESKAIAQSKSSVFARNAKMLETSTMLPHAEYILRRARVYGVRKS